jgi:transposase
MFNSMSLSNDTDMKSVQIVYTRRMAKRVQVQTELTAEELQERYRQTKDAVERTHWHILWQIKEGKSPREVAELLGYTARWVRTIIQRWNTEGEQGIRDHRHDINVSRPLLAGEEQAELVEVLQHPPSDGGLWSGPKVARWMQERLGRPVDPRRGWDALQRVGYRTRVPRPQHAKADEATQQEFKKTARARRSRASRPSPQERGTVEHGRAPHRPQADSQTGLGPKGSHGCGTRGPALSVDGRLRLCPSSKRTQLLVSLAKRECRGILPGSGAVRTGGGSRGRQRDPAAA